MNPRLIKFSVELQNNVQKEEEKDTETPKDGNSLSSLFFALFGTINAKNDN